MPYSAQIYEYIPGTVLNFRNETIVRHAQESDIFAIEALRRADSGSLGMIHKNNYVSIATKSRQDNRDRWKSQHLYVLQDGYGKNAEITGFCYVSYFQIYYAEIIQIAIRQDLRRLERALMLIQQTEYYAKLTNKRYLRARVACDIEAVNFWLAIGFEVTDTVISTHQNRGMSRSQRPLYIFKKDLS